MHPQDVQQLLHDAESVVQQLHPLRNLHVLVHRPAAQGGVDTERHQGRGRKQGAGLVGCTELNSLHVLVHRPAVHRHRQTRGGVEGGGRAGICFKGKKR
jgi:hypothetical protein